MRTVAGILVAGGLGAGSRYWVDGVVSHFTQGHLPWGTFVVNVTACLLLGLIFTVTTERAVGSSSMRLTLTTGFVASYSTFSTLMLESVRLAEDGAYGWALANTAGSMVAGAIAVVAGIFIGRAL
ncbi:MAG: fluoride exporter [Chloroflexota bacterium]|jgi:CrcB protein|nr:fluoride exporter [Chloroflexota bacterium]